VICSQDKTTRRAESNEAPWRGKEKLPVTDQTACGSLKEKEVNAFIYQRSRYRANNPKGRKIK